MKLKGSKATDLLKKIAVDVRWCDSCSVPVTSLDTCGVCGSRTRKVKAVPPADIRPAFSRDLRDLRELLEASYGAKIAEKLLPQRSIVLLNKIEYADAADEVIVGGFTIGTRIYDLYSLKWVFRPEYRGASLLIAERRAYAIVKSSTLKKFQFFERSDIVEGDLPEKGYVAVETADGRYQGLAKVLERGGLRVAKVWKAVPPLPKVKGYSDLSKAIKANEERLDLLENDALRLIENYREGSAVTISGGKDSSAALALAVKAGVRYAVYVDTGVDFAENYNSVKEICSLLGAELLVAKPRDGFWKCIRVFGIQSRDYRWCTRVLKLAPLAKIFSEKGFVTSITGQRKYESVSRAIAAQVSRSYTLRSIRSVVSPIHSWSSLEVFMYLEKESLPINRLYFSGFDRIGCYVCPMLKLPEINSISSLEFSKWNRFLKTHARKHKLPQEWISLALWRWRFKYPPEVETVLSKRGIKAKEIILRNLSSRVNIGLEGNSLRVILVDLPEVNLSLLARNLQNFFDVKRSSGEKLVLEDNIEVYSNGTIVVPSDLIKNIDFIVKSIYSIHVCVRCELCKYSSPDDCPVLKYLHLDVANLVRKILEG